MRMLHTPSERPDDDRISEFEKMIGYTLDWGYRRFLLTDNGGIPDPRGILVPSLSRIVAVGELYGLHFGDERTQLDVMFEALKGRIPNTVMAFADDLDRNLFCMGIGGAHLKRIYHLNRDHLGGKGELQFVANSFGDFLLRLGPHPSF